MWVREDGGSESWRVSGEYGEPPGDGGEVGELGREIGEVLQGLVILTDRWQGRRRGFGTFFEDLLMRSY